ncbi:hypothetical protein B0A64_24710 [Flavobacterium araucananum]|uniref:Methylated-DNA-[protein]-cysteine S-methyltransferase DNA binding domain-containing protein n=2 Tax=Flavobacterium araucananum TaxID=946678 RepID=A0A227NBV8_9FLAO|nr:hypothetical protein B0A64_24710 [Flavobacterium araucananum]
MRRRLHNTQMLDKEVIHIEAWIDADIEETIEYRCTPSLFGDILIASTSKGVCYLGFTNGNHIGAVSDLKRRFPSNSIAESLSLFQAAALKHVNNPQMQLPIQLHLKGTAFQLEIWKKLSQIPLGGLTSYTQLGGTNKIARATGAAVGSNPVGFLIPCHRVIYADGSFNGYFWGTELKERLLLWEAANVLLI